MLKIAWDSCYAHSLPAGHRFPMIKYELLPEQLLHEGTISKKNLFTPDVLSAEDILRVHVSPYWDKLVRSNLSRSEERKIGFPFSQSLLQRERIINQGTIDCAYFAMESGVSMNVAGGTHHAYTDRGEGFCILNDQAIAAKHLLDNKLCERVLIIDLDVHQGNGTAEVFSSDESVFTFSMHGERNYPLHKESSDLDIGLADNTGDQEYMECLDEVLPDLIREFNPDFIFYQSGVDVLETDKLGRLSMTKNGTKERDRLVLETASLNAIPVVVCMGGGYSEKIQDIVEAHANTFRLAQEIYFLLQ